MTAWIAPDRYKLENSVSTTTKIADASYTSVLMPQMRPLMSWIQMIPNTVATSTINIFFILRNSDRISNTWSDSEFEILTHVWKPGTTLVQKNVSDFRHFMINEVFI